MRNVYQGYAHGAGNTTETHSPIFRNSTQRIKKVKYCIISPTVSCYISSKPQTTLGLNTSTHFLSIRRAKSRFPLLHYHGLKGSHLLWGMWRRCFIRSTLNLHFLLQLILQKHMMVDCWLFLPFDMQSWWLILFRPGWPCPPSNSPVSASWVLGLVLTPLHMAYFALLKPIFSRFIL